MFDEAVFDPAMFDTPGGGGWDVAVLPRPSWAPSALADGAWTIALNTGSGWNRPSATQPVWTSGTSSLSDWD